MLVVVSVVLGVPATVVDVIDMVTVRDGNMAASVAMGMVMAFVSSVLGGFAFVVMPAMRFVQVPVVDVVNMVTVWDGDVAAPFAVLVVVRRVLRMFLGHICSLVRHSQGFRCSLISPWQHLSHASPVSRR